ncbi:MAG TPA: hypothetical protein VF631_14480 [Allosphingosinicella sp.]|uniref:hypothetical protein n=1 Tax=Allosphingosinicella sp. TaxID=2823234 RepID=UPI002F2840C0
MKLPAIAAAIFASVLLPTSAEAADPPDELRVQGPAEAVGEDAAEYARLFGVTQAEAASRLQAQEASVGATDRLQTDHADRLAGIWVEHVPDYRIVVLLTGAEPVPGRTIVAGGRSVPVSFETGAAATRAEVIAALRSAQMAIREAFPRAQGMGFDPRTGSLVLMIAEADGWADATEDRRAELEALTGVPSRIRLLGAEDRDTALGGERLEGVDPLDGRRRVCTTGFLVTDRVRTGLVTAAHCPDSLSYRDPGGGEVPLEFVGQWGVSYQDVQVHVGELGRRPLFYAGAGRSSARTVTSWRNRTSTRVGDLVCHRGEASGYSCAPVEYIDYAPPGDLCAGPCAPVWVAVSGPRCRPGDSGGPVFLGTTAFGIAKGANSQAGRCTLYYYMSTDYLPEGWSLLYDDGRGATR